MQRVDLPGLHPPRVSVHRLPAPPAARLRAPLLHFSLQTEEDNKALLGMQELISKLQTKVKSYKQQAENAVSVYYYPHRPHQPSKGLGPAFSLPHWRIIGKPFDPRRPSFPEVHPVELCPLSPRVSARRSK